MKELDIFLKALSNIMKGKRGTYIPRLTKKPSKFGAVQIVKDEIEELEKELKELRKKLAAL